MARRDVRKSMRVRDRLHSPTGNRPLVRSTVHLQLPMAASARDAHWLSSFSARVPLGYRGARLRVLRNHAIGAAESAVPGHATANDGHPTLGSVNPLPRRAVTTRTAHAGPSSSAPSAANSSIFDPNKAADENRSIPITRRESPFPRHNLVSGGDLGAFRTLAILSSPAGGGRRLDRS